jgi:hypothetical protein
MVSKISFLIVALVASFAAQAVCYRDGKPYPTGAEVGGYVCQADGSWIKK